MGSRIFILVCTLNGTSQSTSSYLFFVQEIVVLHRSFLTNRLCWSSISNQVEVGKKTSHGRRESMTKYGKWIICVERTSYTNTSRAVRMYVLGGFYLAYCEVSGM